MSWRDAIARAVLGGKVGGPHPGGIHTYHSSPHDFDKFDWSKLRSGEGANVYGAGFYSAENPKVSGPGGNYWNNFLHRFPEAERSAASVLEANAFNRADAIADTKAMIDYWTQRKGTPESTGIDFKDLFSGAKLQQYANDLALLESGKPIGPRTYELNLRTKPEELLDWDRPLKYQPEVLDKIRSNFVYPFKPEETGQSVYTGFVSYPYGMPNTSRNEAKTIISEKLGEAGVPGIKYLDEGSRQHQQDLLDARRFARMGESVHGREEWARRAAELEKTPITSNYVMFDPGKIDIMAKYALPGLATGGFGALAAQDAYEARP